MICTYCKRYLEFSVITVEGFTGEYCNKCFRLLFPLLYNKNFNKPNDLGSAEFEIIEEPKEQNLLPE